MAATPAEHGGEAFPPFDPAYFSSQIFWLALIFTGMYLVLSRTVLPQIANVIEKRRDRIASDLDRAASLNAMAEKARKARADKIARAQARAQTLKSAATAELAAEIAADLEDHDTDLKERISKARTRIATAETHALDGINVAAHTMAIQIVAKIAQTEPDAALIGEALRAAQQNQLRA